MAGRRKRLPTSDELSVLYADWYERVYGSRLHPSVKNGLACAFAKHAIAQWMGYPERADG